MIAAKRYESVWNAFLKEVPSRYPISVLARRAAVLPPRTPLSKYRELLPDKWKKNIAQG